MSARSLKFIFYSLFILSFTGCGPGILTTKNSSLGGGNGNLGNYPISLVQSVTGVAAGVTTCSTTAFTTNPTVGNRMIVAVWIYDAGSGVVTGVTDNKGNSYSLATSVVKTPTLAAAIYSAPISSTGAGFTVTASASTTAQNVDVVAAEFKNIATNPLDQSATLTGSATSTGSSGTTASTTFGNALAIGVTAFNAGSNPLTPSSGIQLFTDTGSNATGQAVYQIHNTIGPK